MTSDPRTVFGSAVGDARDRMRAAGSRRGVFPAPLRARDSQAPLRADANADELVYLCAPAPFGAVGGFWYGSFRQTADDDVLAESCAT